MLWLNISFTLLFLLCFSFLQSVLHLFYYVPHQFPMENSSDTRSYCKMSKKLTRKYGCTIEAKAILQVDGVYHHKVWQLGILTILSWRTFFLKWQKHEGHCDLPLLHTSTLKRVIKLARARSPPCTRRREDILITTDGIWGPKNLHKQTLSN